MTVLNISPFAPAVFPQWPVSWSCRCGVPWSGACLLHPHWFAPRTFEKRLIWKLFPFKKKIFIYSLNIVQKDPLTCIYSNFKPTSISIFKCIFKDMRFVEPENQTVYTVRLVGLWEQRLSGKTSLRTQWMKNALSDHLTNTDRATGVLSDPRTQYWIQLQVRQLDSSTFLYSPTIQQITSY